MTIDLTKASYDAVTNANAPANAYDAYTKVEYGLRNKVTAAITNAYGTW
jgi:hypothetical protein